MIPASVVSEQARQVTDPYEARRGRGRRYPGEYRNDAPEDEGEAAENRGNRPFDHREFPNSAKLYEVPVNARYDLSRPAARHHQIELAERQAHHNDRARIIQNPLNDPGVYRAIVPAERNTGRVHDAVGVVYHPSGNPTALHRAGLEPLSREGRQFIRRYQDDSANVRHVTTWPPRDEDARDLTTYENRYQQVRRGQPRAGNGR